MNTPLVSIIIPIYNAEKYLRETVQSAIAQTWKNKEIILVDDGSTDGSLHLANTFQSETVKVFGQRNSGASAARNLGLAQSKGEYIQFLDADDLLSRDKIEKQVLALANQSDKIAVCSTVHFYDGQDHLLSHSSSFEDNFIYTTDDPIQFIIKLWGGYNDHASMIALNAWLTPIDLIKKAGPWDETLSLDDDGAYFSKIILNSAGIVKVDDIYNYYRKQSNQKSLSSNKSLKHLFSQLNANLIKKKELFARTNVVEAKQAIHRQLFELILKSYPEYPSVYKIAFKELPKVETVYYQPILGGQIIQKIVELFGWRTARIIQYILTQK